MNKNEIISFESLKELIKDIGKTYHNSIYEISIKNGKQLFAYSIFLYII